MHDPISFGSFWSFADVKHQSFLDANFPALGGNHLISSGGLPIPRPSNPIGSGPIWVLPISGTEKVPLFLSKYSFTCKTSK